ncbi:MAG: phosphoglycerate dehydrogenase [Rhodothermales bacterium]|nr:phosphoglycerate dehydrogenase [Rhodothermales bacterium]
MKILIADTLADVGARALTEAGHDVVPLPKASGDALTEALRTERPNVLVVRSTKVTAEMMDAAPSLELIVRAGAGYDTIDVEGASARGIFVANCPGKNATAVAELAVGLLLALDRRLPENVLDAREGRWNKAAYAKADGLKGRTLGVVGTGSIGQEVIVRALALEMRVAAWSRSLTPALARALGVDRMETPLDVAREADAVTLHVASTPETRHLAGRAFFEAMKPGALFINTTRGAVVDEDALRWALDEKGLRAALDVFENEPAYKEGALDADLARHPNVYLTHHIGASTQQAQDATAEEAARVILDYDASGHVPNCVNLADRSPATHLLTVRHRDRVGVLAAVLDEVRKARWNVQEMENLIFAGAQAAVAHIRFDGDADDGVVRRIEALDDVLAVSLIAL